MYLTPAYFTGDILIPNLADADVNGYLLSDLQNWIAKKEPEFLRYLLGKVLYQDFITGMAQPSPLAKWTALYDQIYFGGAITQAAPVVTKYTGIFSALQIIVPKGCILVNVVTDNGTPNSGQLSCLPASGLPAFRSYGINGSGTTLIPVNMIWSMGVDTMLTLDATGEGDTWNGMTIDVYVTIASLTSDAVTQTGLVPISPAAYYVWFFYTRSKMTLSTNVGEQEAKLQSGTIVSGRDKFIANWNCMSEMVSDIRQFLQANISDYPDYQNLFEWPYGVYFSNPAPNPRRRNRDPLGPISFTQ